MWYDETKKKNENFAHDSCLLVLDSGSRLCLDHKGELHKLYQGIQETQGELWARCFV